MDMLSTNVFAGEASDVSSGIGDIPSTDGAARCERLLRDAGLRPTRQRLMLGQLLFLNGHRHVTAEALHDEAIATHMRLSLATVYNTLNQFTEAGLLRRIAANGSKSFFDTDTTVHPHFYLEGEDVLIDISQDLVFEKFPEALPGHEIARLDVIVHIRKKTS
jgi:Fur family iron response transcriptional regulator